LNISISVENFSKNYLMNENCKAGFSYYILIMYETQPDICAAGDVAALPGVF